MSGNTHLITSPLEPYAFGRLAAPPMSELDAKDGAKVIHAIRIAHTFVSLHLGDRSYFATKGERVHCGSGLNELLMLVRRVAFCSVLLYVVPEPQGPQHGRDDALALEHLPLPSVVALSAVDHQAQLAFAIATLADIATSKAAMSTLRALEGEQRLMASVALQRCEEIVERGLTDQV